MQVDTHDYRVLFGTLAEKADLDERTRRTAARIANWFTAWGTTNSYREQDQLWQSKPFVGDPFRDPSPKLASDGIRFLIECGEQTDVEIR